MEYKQYRQLNIWSYNMKHYIILSALALSACSGNSPADVSFAGLTYNNKNMSFDGLPAASTLPSSGTATYNGILRMNASTENYFDGVSRLEVDFSNSTAVMTGFVDFKGESGIGIYSFSQDIAINGTGFQNIDVTSSNEDGPESIRGNFYGEDASVVGAFIYDTSQEYSTSISGAMIAKRD